MASQKWWDGQPMQPCPAAIGQLVSLFHFTWGQLRPCSWTLAAHLEQAPAIPMPFVTPGQHEFPVPHNNLPGGILHGSLHRRRNYGSILKSRAPASGRNVSRYTSVATRLTTFAGQPGRLTKFCSPWHGVHHPHGAGRVRRSGAASPPSHGAGSQGDRAQGLRKHLLGDAQAVRPRIGAVHAVLGGGIDPSTMHTYWLGYCSSTSFSDFSAMSPDGAISVS